ncbi:hypothetical protein [Nocardia asteroides]|uniref:hypothetical protein n=1 Tax=Nocardia asteroides TaxID=1824 RepID=UPI00342DB41A
MNRNDIRTLVIGVTAGAASVVALLAWVESDMVFAVGEHLARRKLTADERAELDRIKQSQAVASRQACERQIAAKQRQAERDAEDLTKFDRALLSTPGQFSEPAQMSVTELAHEIAHTEHALREANHTSDQPRIRRHHTALMTEWRRRDSYEARCTLPRHESMRHAIAAEKITAASKTPWKRLPTSLPYVD